MKRWIGPTCFALGLSSALLGCAVKSDSLLFTTYTKVGLDISTADGQPAEAVFGYKRFEGAVVPVEADSEGWQEAHSIFAGLCLKNSWLKGLDLAQVFATGGAADQVSNSRESAAAAAEVIKCE